MAGKTQPSTTMNSTIRNSAESARRTTTTHATIRKYPSTTRTPIATVVHKHNDVSPKFQAGNLATFQKNAAYFQYLSEGIIMEAILNEACS